MKNVLLILGLFWAGCVLAQQQITPERYDELKKSGQLDPKIRYKIISENKTEISSYSIKYNELKPSPSSTCDCLFHLDSTFEVVPFEYCTPPDYRSDDSYSPVIALPFSFNLFGTLYDSLYISTNGNISFDFPLSNFASTPLPNNLGNFIAPFWADVDTRNTMSGIIYYKLTRTYLIVLWENVGYYDQHADKENTFELVITDGMDTILPFGKNVAFCYGDMQWTTGDASNGISGIGGDPSTVGINEAGLVNYFQVGEFNKIGNIFDGPNGNPDGIDWLDNLGIYFNTSLPGNNSPNIINSINCDSIDVYASNVGIINPVPSSGFYVFPNPASNELKIENIPVNTNTILITDVIGQIVYTSSNVNEQATINTTSFLSGVYFITFVNENGDREVVKFIRQ